MDPRHLVREKLPRHVGHDEGRGPSEPDPSKETMQKVCHEVPFGQGHWVYGGSGPAVHAGER